MNDAADRIYERLLVVRCQTGDEAAFAELVDRYHPRLRYYLRTVVDDDHAVDDVLQDVWLSVFRGVARLAEPAAFATWLYRIARDKASLRHRRQAAEAHLGETDVADQSLDEEAFSADEAERIHAALSELSAEHREVIVLRFLEDMTYDQIASVTGCRIGTVRSRLYYAKAAMRQTIERMIRHD
jgi:RNA polymerase sigma-70 factor (ECF subfamily)